MNIQREIGLGLATLAEAFRLKELTPATIKIYEGVLKKVPAPLIAPAVERCITTRTYFPKAAELLADCEHVRRELLAKHPFLGCAECEENIGWRTVITVGRQLTVQKCPCRQRYLEKLDALGAGGGQLALPPASDAVDPHVGISEG